MRFILSLLILISSCSSGVDSDSIEIASLVLPDNQKGSYAIQCNLLPKQTIRDLEAIIPTFIKNLKESNDFKNVYIYFDQLQIDKFFLQFEIGNSEESIEKQLLENIFITEHCEGRVDIANVYLLIDSFAIKPNTPYIIERSLCQFADDKGYVDLMLAVDKLVQEGMLHDIKINSTVRELSNNLNFEWINWYPNKTDIKSFKNIWIENNLAQEIQQDFKETAACFGSQKYQAYKLI
jgi:hypothetical protein